ncbi:MFS transporter [Streptomyces sp. SID5474]|nr:MFS transporter [Embleya scabrispora]MYS84980.1 MFS transporter [Streptomyces sp. SID5474]
MLSVGRTPRARLGPSFDRVWASVTVSSLGDGMSFVALPLLAAQLTADPRQIAIVSLAEQAPWLLLGLLSGVLADRLDRRRILWLVDAARAVLVGALAAAVAGGVVTITLLAVVAFLLGCGRTLYSGAWSGMVPALVVPAALTRANARLQASSLITDTLLGTPLGALLFGMAAALPFAVDAVSFAAAAALVLLLRGNFRPPPEPGPTTWTSLRRDTTEGVRWLRRHHPLRRLCLASGINSLVGGGLIAILVLYAQRILGLGNLGFALLIASFALGGVLGALSTPAVTARFGAARILRPAAAGTALAAVVVGSATSGPVAALGIAMYGAANLAWNVTAVSLRQLLVPAALLGRVTMAYQMVIAGGTALGAVVAGFAAHAFGLRAPFHAGAGLVIVAGLISTRSSTARAGTPPPAGPVAGAGDGEGS